MKASRTFLQLTGLLMALISFLLSGCAGSGNKDTQANQEAADTLRQEVSLTPDQHNLLYSFPTPFEVTRMLEKAKAGFIFDITNPPDQIVKYNTEYAKAINLGIYSADLSYSAVYNRIDETNKFLACTEKLANDLGIAGVYDQTLLEKIRQNSNNKDTMVALITRLLTTTNDYLSRNNRNQIAVLIACGGFVEGMYLAISLTEVAKDNRLIANVILLQKESLDKLMIILNAYQNDAKILKVAGEIGKLQKIYTDYGLVANKNIPMLKAAEMADLAESVRLTFVK